jgi:hypothetical protein
MFDAMKRKAEVNYADFPAEAPESNSEEPETYKA